MIFDILNNSLLVTSEKKTLMRNINDKIMPKSSKKNSKKAKRTSKSSHKEPTVSNQSNSTNQSIDIEEFLTKIQTFVQDFRTKGGRGALISNNLETKRDSDPFHILISCIISLRTKDEVTEKITEKLYQEVSTPSEFLTLNDEELSKLIYPTAFYGNKAKQILDICKILVDDYESKVPDDIDTLLHFKGVGRKTANLVVTLGFNKPGICVDTHVARITQRIGFVPYKKIDEEKKIVFRSADDVEKILRKNLPKKWWIPINDLLVTYGQTICVPISPKCSQCFFNKQCVKIGVSKSR